MRSNFILCTRFLLFLPWLNEPFHWKYNLHCFHTVWSTFFYCCRKTKYGSVRKFQKKFIPLKILVRYHSVHDFLSAFDQMCSQFVKHKARHRCPQLWSKNLYLKVHSLPSFWNPLNTRFVFLELIVFTVRKNVAQPRIFFLYPTFSFFCYSTMIT